MLVWRTLLSRAPGSNVLYRTRDAFGPEPAPHAVVSGAARLSLALATSVPTAPKKTRTHRRNRLTDQAKSAIRVDRKLAGTLRDTIGLSSVAHANDSLRVAEAPPPPRSHTRFHPIEPRRTCGTRMFSFEALSCAANGSRISLQKATFFMEGISHANLS